MGITPNRKVELFFYLGAGFLIVLVSLYGFSLLRARPGLPQGIDKHTILQVDDYKIQSGRDLDFILSRHSIGDRATFILQKGRDSEKTTGVLIPYFSQVAFPLFYLLIGFFCLLMGVVVYLLRPEELRARIFYWLALAFSSALIISGDFASLGRSRLSYVPGILFNLLYPLAPALLLHFSLSFARPRSRWARIVIYLPAALFSLVLGTLFVYSGFASSIQAFRTQQFLYIFFRSYIVLFSLLSVVALAITYRRSHLRAVKAQIKWIFYGFFLGLGPFMLLYQLPQALGLNSIISEEIANTLFIAIPLTFGISIVKYKLMDIELVINRSLVYSFLTIFTVSIFLFSLEVFRNLFSKTFFAHESAIALAAAVLAAAAFNPGRKKIQLLVDKTFFRQAYDYRKAVLGFSEKAQKTADPGHLIDLFLSELVRSLPLSYLGAYIYDRGPNRNELLLARGKTDDLESIAVLALGSGAVLARGSAAEVAEDIDFSRENFLEERKLEMIFPIGFGLSNYSGFLALGKKKSGQRYSAEDMELIATLAGDLALNIERIKLQEEVIYERASREKLDELNRLKTEFISTVSHELRTPMSSIQGLTELLQSGKIRDRGKRGQLLDVLACESSRLSRMLHNILDFGRIEQEVKSYEFRPAEIQPVIQEVIGLFRYNLESDGFVLRSHLPTGTVCLSVDRDGVKQALINLIDNAIKYSTDRKEIDVYLIEQGDKIKIQVKDRGMGVRREDQKRIFEKFYRSPSASRHNPKGIGLGLKIVRHIMDAHGGSVELSSEEGEGSTFGLVFQKP